MADISEVVAHGATLMEVRPILRHVSKPWGSERWLANTPDYCGKILRLDPGRGTSLHYHRDKRETFYVLSGLLRLRLGSRAQRTELLTPTQAFDLPAGVPHRLECCGEEPCEVLEVSTHHDDSDSYRISVFEPAQPEVCPCQPGYRCRQHRRGE